MLSKSEPAFSKSNSKIAKPKIVLISKQDIPEKPDNNFFIKFNKRILKWDMISVCFGVVGITLGTLSFLALLSFWKDDQASIWLTVVAIFFDTASFSFAFFAFFKAFRFFLKYHSTIKIHTKIDRLDKQSLSFDFTSFLVGFTGTICEIVSLVVLIPRFYNSGLSYDVTIIGVCFDVVSTLSALCAGLITLKIIKSYKEEK